MNKEYTFNEGFTIKVRKEPFDTFYAMGETHISECYVYDVYDGKKFIETFDTFQDARECGSHIISA
jgi:hypothetical protein